jgi:DNA polymerase III sliding clamp (beta) subunit (PCNA family)
MSTTTPNAVQVDRRAFLAALSRVAPLASRNQYGKPILANVRALAAGGTLNLLATDFSTSLSIDLAVEGGYSGAFLLPAREVLKALRTWTAETLTLTVTPEQITLSEPGAHLPYPVVDPGLFPSHVDDTFIPRFSIEAGLLARTVECSVPFCIPKGYSRPNLQGVHVVMNRDGVRWEASDGHRLTVRQTRPDRANRKAIADCIVPADALALFSKAVKGQSGTVAVAWGERNCRFTLGDVTMTARFCEGTYSAVMHVVPNPDRCTTWAKFDPAVVTNAVKAIGALSQDHVKPLAVRVDAGRIVFAAEPNPRGQAVHVRPAQHAGLPACIGFNAAYVLQTLALSRGGAVEVGIQDKEGAPTLWRFSGDPDFRAVLMPYQLTFEAPDVALPAVEAQPEAEPAPVPAVQTQAGRIGAHVRALWLSLSARLRPILGEALAFASRYFARPALEPTQRASKVRSIGTAIKSTRTPEQRQEAARKAVATRRQRLAAG